MISSNFFHVSLETYNYIFLFFNYESLVVICFFFFLIFALLSEKGQLGTYLYDISLDQHSKLSRYLVYRDTMTLELVSFVNDTVFAIRKIASSYDASSHDLLLDLQYITKKLLTGLTFSQIRGYLDTPTLRTQYPSLQIKLYLTQDLFANKSFALQPLPSKENEKNRKFVILPQSQLACLISKSCFQGFLSGSRYLILYLMIVFPFL
jgi:hypothetical protein